MSDNMIYGVVVECVCRKFTYIGYDKSECSGCHRILKRDPDGVFYESKGMRIPLPVRRRIQPSRELRYFGNEYPAIYDKITVIWNDYNVSYNIRWDNQIDFQMREHPEQLYAWILEAPNGNS